MYVIKTDLINVNHKQKFSTKFWTLVLQHRSINQDNKNKHSQDSSINLIFFNIPGFFNIFIIV